MGNGVMKNTFKNKTIYIKLLNTSNIQKVIFNGGCSSRDLQDQLSAVCGLPRGSPVLLKDRHGAHVTVSPAMNGNSIHDPFVVDTHTYQQNVSLLINRVRHRATADATSSVLGAGGDKDETITNTVAAVAAQLQKVFRIEELKADFGTRIASLEKRLENSKRVIEIEKFKYEIADIRDAFLTHQRTRHVDFARLRPAVTLPATFFSPGTVREHVITLQREPPAFTKYKLTPETTESLKQPSFDVWQWEPNEMLVLIEHMYRELGLLEEFCISPSTIRNFLVSVQENYRNNPFHNFRHCFCVTQMMYCLIFLCRLPEKLSKRELCVLITACICHDLDHPGYNNSYQINARTELAVRYNDASPLENHHCAVGFRILANPECNIFSSLPESLFKEIRGEIILLILATDMARHSEIVDDFKKKLENFDYKNVNHLTALKMILIKNELTERRCQKSIERLYIPQACDISNEVRPSKVAEPWVDCLLEEYFNQAETEKQEGLPVAPFMDRDKVTKASAQISFIKFVLIPLFEDISQLFPQVEEALVLPLRHAREHYEQLKEAEEDMRRLAQSKSIA